MGSSHYTKVRERGAVRSKGLLVAIGVNEEGYRDRFLAKYGETDPKACVLLEEAFDDVTQVLHLPMNLRRRLCISNAIERVNEEIRRRERVIQIFPNEESLHRLIGALLIDIHEEWQAGRRYLSLAPEGSAQLVPAADSINSSAA